MSSIPNNLSDAQPLVLTRSFNDVDAFAGAVQSLNITSNQLTPGSFLGSINMADLGCLKFTHINQNQTLRVTGIKASDQLLFGITLQSEPTPVISHGRLIKKQDIFGFNPNLETDLVIGKDSHIVFVAINRQVFDSLNQEMGYDFGKKFIQQNSLRLHSASLRFLRAYYQQITQVLSRQSSLLMQSEMQSLVRENFLPLLIFTLGKCATKKGNIPKQFQRFSLVNKAEKIAMDYRDKPLTLQQLCDEIGTSSSALCYSFKEMFGMSPMAYIKIQRLNGVRRTLKEADPNTTTVMGVALKWGFWSAGHFSKDYKKLFGELPSETLRTE